MYRLLIVDDEPAIVKGLSKIFQEESTYEFEVYKAYSADEALWLIQDVKIDILLSDIHMPGKGGFELAEEVLNKWRKCRIIFLTGYNEFEYIYRAINQLNAKYILKSEDDDEILNKVEQVVQTIEQAKKEYLSYYQEVIAYKQHEYCIKNQYLSSLLLSVRKNRDLNCMIEQINLKWKEKVWIYIGKLIHKKQVIEQVIQMICEIKKVLYKGFEESFHIEIFEYTQDYIVCLLQPKEEGLVHKQLVQLSEEYQEIIMELFGWPLSVVFSREGVEMEHLQIEFKRLYKLIEKEKDSDIPRILEITAETYTLLSSEEDSENMMIIKLEKYIQQNIGDELTLTKLASVIHLNPCYLSRYYRKVRGSNLSDFIKNMKIERSKNLLLCTNRKIGDIAIELGFESQSYFCKVFKKNTGVSPIEFRRKDAVKYDETFERNFN